MNQIDVEVIRLLQKELQDLQRFAKQTNRNMNMLGKAVVDLSHRVRSLEGEGGTDDGVSSSRRPRVV